jgi:HSP20 family protein
MQLTRRAESWDPFQEIDELKSRVNRLFGLTKWDGDLADWVPSCNVSEDEKEYRIRMELPDVKKEDVHVNMDNGVLIVQGERKEEKEEKGVRFHRRELSYGKFVRRFTLPEEIDESRIQANYRDGMLNLILEKAKVKSVKVKEIPVN